MTNKKELFMDSSKLVHHPKTVKKWKEGEQIFPIHVEISPSSGCNNRCILCCVDYKKHKREDLSEDLMNRLPEDLKESGVKSYLLAGEGEPFLNKYCTSMVQKSKELGIDGAMTSNGILFTPEIANATMHGFSWIRFSIQSFNPTIYSYVHQVPERQLEIVIKNIEHSVKIREKHNLETKIGIQQILINENGNAIVESATKAKKLGVDYWTIKRFSKHPNNIYDVPEELYKKCEEQFKEAENLSDRNFKVIIRRNQFENQPRNYNKCIGLPFIVPILANGELYPCCQFFDKPQMSYGNLYDNTFKEIMSSKRAKKIVHNIEKNYDVIKNNCMTFCRHHSTNLYLYEIKEGKRKIVENPGLKPEHINFI